MAESETPQRRLADRLRELRTQSLDTPVTQAQLAAALGTSVPLVSSWENANAVPPEERLKAYALLFASAPSRPLASLTLPDEADLSDAEEVARRRLIDELVALREQAVRGASAAPQRAGALGGRFWCYPEGAQVRIITTTMWKRVLEKIPYSDPRHPNYIQAYADADADATIELFGHLRAENPTADVRFLTADRATQEDLSGNVVVLGQADSLLSENRHPGNEAQLSVLEYLAPRLELPLGTRTAPDGDPELDIEFIVTLDEQGNPQWFPQGIPAPQVEVHRPRFLRNMSAPGRPRRYDDGYPVLEYDVAVLARKRNQLNLATSVTICSGVFSRGTYGAVRALTDVLFRSRNERFLERYFGGLDDFWIVFYVPVFRGAQGLDTMTPDLERPFHRLRSSATSATATTS